MVDGSSMWGLLTILGPILLGVVLLWAVLSNRRSKGAKQRTEAATHELYKTIDREDKAGDAARAERRDV
ncbi:MAG: hypothetical protein JWL91_947 [Sphingomonas bacterium]|jgi:hypothetical protein|nr:hypothetical protein [Sphingomonas bacterium]MDB5689071.1 hypothetical protein [Sphingomonas bacterium]